MIGSKGDKFVDSILSKKIDGNQGVMRAPVPKTKLVDKSSRLNMKTVSFQDKKFDFIHKISRSENGKHDFFGESKSDAKCTLSKETASQLAQLFVSKHFPEIASRVRLKEVNPRYFGILDSANGIPSTRLSGYLVQYQVVEQSVPIFGDYINVSFVGDKIDGVSVLCHDRQVSEPVGIKRVEEFLEFEAALTRSLQQIKRSLNIRGSYEIIEADLTYVRESIAKKQTADSGDFIAAWHLIIDSREGFQKRGALFDVWVSAVTGEIIGIKRK